MKYCRRCIQPDTRPGVVFDEDQVCQACRMAEQREALDWSQREQELEQIIDWAKTQGREYDAVVAVSGGKDTTLQAIKAKEAGLHCLLVNCAPDGISEAGRQNIENLIQKGFDCIHIRPNPKVERYLARKCFFEYGNFVKPLEYPLYASAFNVALKFNVPLVVQGENPAETLGVSQFDISGDALQWRNANTVKDSVDIFCDDCVSERGLALYRFPEDTGGIKAVFFGYYLKEWSNHRNTQFAVEHGLKGRPNHNPMATGRTNKYFSIDADLKIINQNILKYYKFGFGAVTDELCYDIREGLITRDEAIRLATRYDGKCDDSYIQAFCDYLDISLYEFWRNVWRHTNPLLFYWLHGGCHPRFRVGRDEVQNPYRD